MKAGLTGVGGVCRVWTREKLFTQCIMFRRKNNTKSPAPYLYLLFNDIFFH